MRIIKNYTLNITLDNPEEIDFLNVLTPKKLSLEGINNEKRLITSKETEAIVKGLSPIKEIPELDDSLLNSIKLPRRSHTNSS